MNSCKLLDETRNIWITHDGQTLPIETQPKNSTPNIKKTEEAKTFVGGKTQWLQRNLRAADVAAVSLSLSASKMDLYK